MARAFDSDARDRATCPKCGAPPGWACRRPSGRKAWPPHTERGVALTQLPDYDPEDYVAGQSEDFTYPPRRPLPGA